MTQPHARWRDRIAATRDIPAYQGSIAALPPSVEGLTGMILNLRMYPIKSLGRCLFLQQAMIGRNGFCTADGSFSTHAAMLGRRMQKGSKPGVTHQVFTQRNFPKLVLCTPRLERGLLHYRDTDDTVHDLWLSPGDFHPHRGLQRTIAEMHQGETMDAVVEGEGGKITLWVRDFLKRHGYLYDTSTIDVLLTPEDLDRRTRDHHRRGQAGTMNYQDGAPFTVADMRSFQWMQDLRQEETLRSVWMDAFRPNIVTFFDQPNVEDVIDTLAIHTSRGEVKLLYGLASVRCKMIDIDHETGLAPDNSVQGWLKRNRPFRPDDPKGPDSTTFTINATFENGSEGAIIEQLASCRVVKEKD
jgi:uncharacterized protein YcbX